MTKLNSKNKKRSNNNVVIVMAMVLLLALALSGCKKDKKPDVIIDNESTAKPVVETTETPTEAPEVEATPAPTEVPEVEATPAPTEETTEGSSEEYEGINMESTLPGKEWLETFVGIVDEPKVVVFSDESGKKVIVEQDGEIVINPDEDAIALFFPEGYTNGHLMKGVKLSETKSGYATEYYDIFYLDAEEMRAKEEWNAAFMVMYGEEKHPLYVKIIIE